MANASIYVPLTGKQEGGTFIREKVKQLPTFALLIHSNHFDGHPNILDSTVNETRIAKNGDPVHSDIRAKFGNTSIHLDSNDHLDIENSGEFTFGENDFAIDFWMWPFSGRSVFTLGNPYSDHSITLDLLNGGTLNYTAPGDITPSASIDIGTIALNMQWYHVVVAREGNILKCWIDGIYIGNLAVNNVDFTSSALYSVRIGTGTIATGSQNSDPSLDADVFIDEFRIVTGSSEWSGTADFTPPTVQYS